jgi:uncharacterized protein YsxB (DUF464 family)
MIKVVKNGNDIKIFGHADFADYGKDIVCASVSSIIYTTVNGIKNIDNNAIEFIDNDNFMEIKVLKDDEVINKLINNMLDLIKDLMNQYPKHILISEEKY